jgi:ADP-ribosyl-[dinitrogen reductase] hydrolase
VRAPAAPTRRSRILGALLGLTAGDALGATVEFVAPGQMAARFGRHTEIIGGGAFGWRPGQGTDDSDLAFALAQVYRDGYSRTAAAEAFTAWYRDGPADVGGTTARALAHFAATGDPDGAGAAALGPNGAGNGSLMRALATGLVRRDPTARVREAAEISAVTHVDQRCLDACVAYTHIVAALVEGTEPARAVADAGRAVPAGSPVLDLLATAPGRRLTELPTTGYVLHSLAVAVWAVMQPGTLEDLLVDIVNRGDDADTTGAIAGGLLGARDGHAAIPERWARVLEYGPEAHGLADRFAALAADDRTGPLPALTWVGAYGSVPAAVAARDREPRALAIGHDEDRGWQLLVAGDGGAAIPP